MTLKNKHLLWLATLSSLGSLLIGLGVALGERRSAREILRLDGEQGRSRQELSGVARRVEALGASARRDAATLTDRVARARASAQADARALRSDLDTLRSDLQTCRETEHADARAFRSELDALHGDLRAYRAALAPVLRKTWLLTEEDQGHAPWLETIESLERKLEQKMAELDFLEERIAQVEERLESLPGEDAEKPGPKLDEDAERTDEKAEPKL